ncbi:MULTISPECIES: YmaF family protein [unclassified Paenibacillus]|uniref:YmaF family protein n=1 Tax=unclassified Paenibacillus TaxID=185978 RepID=UPI00311A8790
MKKKRPTIKKIRTGSTQAQRHVHEFEGSTKLAEEGADRHNHRFAGVTGQAIRAGASHMHFVTGQTTLNDGHVHKFNFATLIQAPLV